MGRPVLHLRGSTWDSARSRCPGRGANRRPAPAVTTGLHFPPRSFPLRSISSHFLPRKLQATLQDPTEVTATAESETARVCAPDTHTHARTHKHMHTCMHTCVRVHVHAHANTQAHMCACTRMHTQTHMHACTHTYTRAHIYTHMHTLTPADMRTHMHTRTHGPSHQPPGTSRYSPSSPPHSPPPALSPWAPSSPWESGKEPAATFASCKSQEVTPLSLWGTFRSLYSP